MGVLFWYKQTITNGVGFCYGSITGDGAIAPSIIDILSDQITAGVVNAHHIAQGIPVEIVGCRHTINSMLHTDDGIAVIEEDNPFSPRILTFEILGRGFRNQAAGMVIVELLVGIEQLPHNDGVHAGGAFQIGIGFGHSLTVSVIGEAIGLLTGCLGAFGQPGKLAPSPGSGHAIVTGGTAHGVICDGGVTTIILPPHLLAVKKKPPRPYRPGWLRCNL